jgi:hypothetical protein
MPARVDWDNWRTKFIKGPDDLDLKRLSEYTGAPAHQSLRNRSSAEDWPNQRRRYRDSLGTQSSTHPDVQATVAHAQKIIDSAEMLTRHMQAARLVGQKAILAMKATDPTTLKPGEALALLKWAIDAERMVEGMATDRQEVIDISTLTDSALEKLANGG